MNTTLNNKSSNLAEMLKVPNPNDPKLIQKMKFDFGSSGASTALDKEISKQKRKEQMMSSSKMNFRES